MAVGAKLWLVHPLGFRLDAKHLRRAGLDYWAHLDWEAVDDWASLRRRLPDRPFWYVTPGAPRSVWEATFAVGDVLVFGRESRGLPAELLRDDPQRHISLPIRPEARSLNLASTANTVVYEAVRQFGGLLP